MAVDLLPVLGYAGHASDGSDMVAFKDTHRGASLAEGDVDRLLSEHLDKHLCRCDAAIIDRGPRPVENDGLKFTSIVSSIAKHGDPSVPFTGHAKPVCGV